MLKPDSWRYVTEGMKPNLPSVQALEAYLQGQGMRFYAKQGRDLGQEVRLHKLTLKSHCIQQIPAEHRGRLIELFEAVRWEHLTTTRQKIEKLIEEIPRADLRRMRELARDDNPYRNFYHVIPGWVGEQVSLKTLKSCREWLAKTPAEREQWFTDAAAAIAELKATDEFYKRVHEQAKRQATPRGAKSYHVLGIQPGATRAEIKAAFRQKAKTSHPDHGGDPEEFKRLMAAYRQLVDRTA